MIIPLITTLVATLVSLLFSIFILSRIIGREDPNQCPNSCSDPEPEDVFPHGKLASTLLDNPNKIKTAKAAAAKAKDKCTDHRDTERLLNDMCKNLYGFIFNDPSSPHSCKECMALPFVFPPPPKITYADGFQRYLLKTWWSYNGPPPGSCIHYNGKDAEQVVFLQFLAMHKDFAVFKE